MPTPTRSLTLLWCCALIAGCATLPEDATPLDIAVAQDRFFADNPGAAGVEIQVQRVGSVDVFRNGAAVFASSAAASGLQTRTRVAELSANTLCLAPADTWSGLCIEVFESASEGLYCVGTFGNGAGFSQPCTTRPIAPDA